MFSLKHLAFPPDRDHSATFQTHQSSSPLQAATTGAFEPEVPQPNLTSHNSAKKILYTMWVFHFVTNIDSCKH